MLLIIWHDLDQVFWTYSYTFSTCFTCFFIYNCHTVYNVDRIERTCLNTASVSKTSIRTGFRSAILHHVDHSTVAQSVIFIFLFCFFTVSATFYKCNFMYLCTCSNAHDLSDFCCYRSASDRTSADFSFSFYDCRSKSGTSGITTATAVISRKYTKDGLFPFIYLYRKFLAGNTEEYTNE